MADNRRRWPPRAWRLGLVALPVTVCAALAAVPGTQAPELSAEQVVRNIAAKRFGGRPITMRVTGDRLRSAVEALQEASGLSIELDPAVYELARRTASDRNVIVANRMPWDALLDAILNQYQLGIAAEGGRLVVRSSATAVQAVGGREPASGSSVWYWIVPSASLLAAGTGLFLFIRKRTAETRDRSRFAIEPALAGEIKTRILHLFDVEKVYRNEDLSLRNLAARLSLPPHHVSWVLNEVLGVSFSRLVNDYRVNEVKKRLRDPRESGRPILHIAFDAGFSTKTSFNKVFKAQTGMTPSEFRDRPRD